MAISILVNGRPETLETPLTISELLRRLELEGDGVAVAVDRRVVPRSRHALHTLDDGARVEIIRAVGGG